MGLLIFRKVSYETVRNLTTGLDINTYHLKSEAVPPASLTAIRWGYVTSIPIRVKIVYNCARAIRNASNKRLGKAIMKRAGIPIPRLTTKTPCVGRPDYHYGGKRFFFCQTQRDVREARRRGATYFSAFYPKQKEYRVHVAHGKALIVAEKMCEDKTKLIWNYRIGKTHFRILKWDEYLIHVVEPAVKAVEALGLDFGAVDVMADPLDRTLPPAVVCEVNTASRLEEYNAARYREYFAFLLRSNTRREHFDGTKTGYRFRHRELAL